MFRSIFFAIAMVIFFTPSISLGGTGNLVGEMVENGCDENKFKIIIEGVTAGDSHSIFQYGQLYYYGVCVNKDFNQSFLFYSKAATEGHSAAFYHVALMYHLGLGTERNEEKASIMMHELLQADYKPAQDYLCSLTEDYGLKLKAWIDKFSIKCKAQVIKGDGGIKN